MVNLGTFVNNANDPRFIFNYVEYAVICESIKEQEKLLKFLEIMPSEINNMFVVSYGSIPTADSNKWPKDLRMWCMQEGAFRYFEEKGVKFKEIFDKELIRDVFDKIDKGIMVNPFKK